MTKGPGEPHPRYEALLGAYRRGALDQAETQARQMLSRWPDHAGTLQLLGVIEARRGRFDEALPLLERAAAGAPDDGSVHEHRANVLLALERLPEAVAAYDRAAALGAESPQAANNRGTALQALQRFDAALVSYERALELQPDFADALLNRGELLLELGRHAAAAESLRQAREAGADDAKIGFALASLGVEAPAEAAPPQFVRELFDQYAHGFDAHLTGRLGYRVPQLVATELRALRLAPAAFADLGCGTGLCGPLLRPHATRLDGVDLSSAMLEQAHRREVYDSLDCAELVAWLFGRPQCYDVAVAADVLIYFGALEPVFAAVHGALRPRGWFVFTVEAGEGADFELQPTRRYTHARGYLERLAAQQGFAVQRLAPEVLRSEARQDVAGWLAVLQRLD